MFLSSLPTHSLLFIKYSFPVSSEGVFSSVKWKQSQFKISSRLFCEQTKSLGICLVLVVWQSLWKEGQGGSNEESGAASDEEAEPPGPQPALVSLSEIDLLARRYINLQTGINIIEFQMRTKSNPGNFIITLS